MSEIKPFIVALLTGIAAYLHPISGNVFALIWLLGGNFVIGLFCGLVVYNEDFDWRKMWQCFYEALIIFGIVAFVYIVGKENGNHEGAKQCVSMIVYAAIYFYGVRILRNLRCLMKKESPAWHLMNFFYVALSMEFIKIIPYLGEYLNKHKDEDNTKRK